MRKEEEHVIKDMMDMFDVKIQDKIYELKKLKN